MTNTPAMLGGGEVKGGRRDNLWTGFFSFLLPYLQTQKWPKKMLHTTWRNALSRCSRDKQDTSRTTKEYYKPQKNQSTAHFSKCSATQQFYRCRTW